jgi:stalled ribosome alternative rescue factor ArfA
MKKKKRINRAKSAVSQPRFRSRLTPAKKGTKAYRRRPKHQPPEGEPE